MADAFTTIVDCAVRPAGFETHGDVTYWVDDVREYVPLTIVPPAGVGGVPVEEVSVTTAPPSVTVLQPAPVMVTVPPSPPELLPPELLAPPELLLLAPELLPPELLLAPELLPPELLVPELLAPPELLLAPELLPPSALPTGVPGLFPELLLQADVRTPPRTATAAHRLARRRPFVSV